MNRIVRIFAVVFIGILLAGCGKREYTDGIESLENGNYEEAVKSLEKAVEKKRSVGDAFRGIGIAKWETEDFEGALEAFESALENGAEETAALCNLMGSCKLKLGEPAEAVEYYEKGLAKEGCTDKLAQEMKFNVIAAYERLEDWENVKTKLAEYTAEYPEDEQALKEAEFLETR